MARKPPVAEDAPSEAVQNDPETPMEEAAAPVAEARIATKLSDAAKAELTERARKKVHAEIARKESDAFLDAELARLRKEAGVDKPGLGGVNDDIVSIRIDLGDPDDGMADQWIQLDMPHGMRYRHGHTYEVPRHIANVLNEQMFRLMLHNLNKEGKSVYRNRRYNSLVSKTGIIDQGAVH